MMRVLILPLQPGTDAAMANPTPLLLLLSIAHASNSGPDATGFSVPSIGPELDALIAEFRNRPITPLPLSSLNVDSKPSCENTARRLSQRCTTRLQPKSSPS
jgi:hypothetical protein